MFDPRSLSAAVLLLVVTVPATLFAVSPTAAAGSVENAILARIDTADGNLPADLPVFAHLEDGGGQSYALVIAGESVLQASSHAVHIIDRDAGRRAYIIALERRPGAIATAIAIGESLYDDGRRVIVRWRPGVEDELSSLGFDLAFLPKAPLVLLAPLRPSAPSTIDYDPVISDMIDAVDEPTSWQYLGELTGAEITTVGGSSYTITTRHTASGEPLEKATQRVFEHMELLGLETEYHEWSAFSYSNRNVIGTLTGTSQPDEIVLMTAHLDDMPSSGSAPGADDNGSGSTALMIASEILSQHQFNRTIRFVFFTGEEQGLLGADVYAGSVAGENITAVVNLDMVGWNSDTNLTFRLHTRTTSNPGYPGDLAIANTFEAVVSTYGLGGELTPVVDPDGITASDHSVFWSRGFSAILGIEDDVSDFNPYYHTSADTRSQIDADYFVAAIKAAVGTVAHLAERQAGPVCFNSIVPTGLAVDTLAIGGSSSNVNGVLEPGEVVVIAPTWRHPEDCPASEMMATASNLVSPPTITAFLFDGSADYGTLSPGQASSCLDTGNCYLLSLGNVPNRPTLHLESEFREALTTGGHTTWALHIGQSFADVPPDRWAYRFIETMLHSGITSGCGGEEYCPGGEVSRWQMAAFLAQAMTGGDVPVTGWVPGLGFYACFSGTGGKSVFTDVAPTDPACSAIHYIAAEGVTAGCGGGEFCSEDLVDRWQMAVFLARATADGQPIPTSGSIPGLGDYDCSTGSAGLSIFADVDPGDPGCSFIHQVAADGITVGCSAGLYCPSQDLTRDQMAVFTVKAFDFVLYGP